MNLTPVRWTEEGDVAKRRKKKRKWTRVTMSPELLMWLEPRIMEILQEGDRCGPGKAHWTFIATQLDVGPHVPGEWTDLSAYGRGKILGMFMDKLAQEGIAKRKKNFHPYILINPLDRIVNALDKDDAEGLRPPDLP